MEIQKIGQYTLVSISHLLSNDIGRPTSKWISSFGSEHGGKSANEISVLYFLSSEQIRYMLGMFLALPDLSNAGRP